MAQSGVRADDGGHSGFLVGVAGRHRGGASTGRWRRAFGAFVFRSVHLAHHQAGAPVFKGMVSGKTQFSIADRPGSQRASVWPGFEGDGNLPDRYVGNFGKSDNATDRGFVQARCGSHPVTTVFVGDTGTEIILDCGTDISTGTLFRIEARKPNGTKIHWTATLDGTRKIKYAVQAGDLDTAGKWALQAYVELPGWSGRGEIAAMQVSSNA